MTLRIGPGNRIDQEYRIQIVAQNGREVGGFTGNISAELNKPTRWQHGEMVFVFENNSLIRLQTFDKGGRKITSLSSAASSGWIAASMRRSPRKKARGGAGRHHLPDHPAADRNPRSQDHFLGLPGREDRAVGLNAAV